MRAARRDAVESAILAAFSGVPGFRFIPLPPDPKRRLGDVLVRGPHHGVGLWSMAEIKSPGGHLSPEQQRLIDLGLMVIVREREDLARVLGI